MKTFNETLIRCSQIGKLMTEPKTKAEKEAGNLSATAKEMLIEVYVREKYGREKDMASKYTEKGKLVEEESITMFSRLEKKIFEKNTERVTNDFLTGEYDLFIGKSPINADVIIDIKSSWDLFTFFANKKSDKLNDIYWWQLQGYMALSGAKKGIVAYCLTDAPESILLQEGKKLLYNMNVISEESPEYIKAYDKLVHSMVFADIPINERIIKFEIDRDDEAIDSIYNNVRKARKWLIEFDNSLK